MNQIKTVVLLGLMTGLLMAIGGALGGRQGALIFLLIAAVMNFSAYWFSDKLVLRHYRAQPVEPGNAPGLYRIVQELAVGENLPMPKVYLIQDPTPNAFATGRNPAHAAVAVTTGIVEILSQRELKAVLGPRDGPCKKPRHLDRIGGSHHSGRGDVDGLMWPSSPCSSEGGHQMTTRAADWVLWGFCSPRFWLRWRRP